jgi:hypothetical protein
MMTDPRLPGSAANTTDRSLALHRHALRARRLRSPTISTKYGGKLQYFKCAFDPTRSASTLAADPVRSTSDRYGNIQLLAQTPQTVDHGTDAMPVDPSTAIISHAIQLAIAPVFLLTGIAGLLGVMATRLGRIIDRARSFEKTWPSLNANARAAARVEMDNLERRRRVCSWSINYCTSAALLVCLVIVALFVEEFFATNLQWLAGALFVGAMLAVICGLVCFLREVYLATHTISIDHTLFE